MTNSEDKPLISVVMAVYNGENCLQRTIESILDQTFQKFEFVIVDDCSTDRTVDYVKTFNDPRIKLFYNNANLGQTKSLNKGLMQARGKYIARIDADDYSMPERLAKQYQFVLTHPEYTVVGTDCVTFDDSDQKRSVSRGLSRFQDIVIKLMTGGSPINHVSVLMNADAVIKVGGYDPSYKIVADLF